MSDKERERERLAGEDGATGSCLVRRQEVGWK